MPLEEQISRLRELANQVREYQFERDWSDARLCKEIANIGSTKPFKRILDDADPLDEMDIERQLKNYENAVEIVNSKRAKDRQPEKEYDDFRNIVSVRKAVATALAEESIARFVCVEGENGTGKDASMNAMVRSWPKITVPVEADEFWRESLAAPLADMINALGIKRQSQEKGEPFRMPFMPIHRRDLLIEELSKRRVILCINEGHSLGPRIINSLKMIINKTQTVVVLFCVPVLLNRLIQSGYEECAQLFGNRLCRRIRLESPEADEILTLCERRGVKFDSSSNAHEFANRLQTECPSFGNWRFIIRTVRKVANRTENKALDFNRLIDCITDAKSDCICQQSREKRVKS